MTSQEISEFVNQPTPRKVPSEVSRKITDWCNPLLWGCIALFLMFFVMIHATASEVSIIDYFRLLNSGTQGRATAPGSIISIEPTRLWGVGFTSYNLTTHFSTSSGDRIVVNYVWRRSNIPGWGVIPETQNDPSITEVLLLTKPFPVTVEYFRARPQVAWAVGTRFPIGITDDAWLVVLCIFPIIVALVLVSKNAIISTRILKKGLFTTGYISTHKDLSTFANSMSILSIAQKALKGNTLVFIASFADHRGIQRESFIRMPSDAGNEGWLEDFFRHNQTVGLLYLPDTNAVIVTDLWLASNPTIVMSQKHAPERNGRMPE